MSVGEGWCGRFHTPVCSYKLHALTVYLHSTFTVPHFEYNRTSAVKHFCKNSQHVRPLAIFAEELHRVSLTRCLTEF